jgi:hypothetical protein
MAPKFEKVAMDADPLQTEHITPNAGQDFLGGCAWRDVR